MKEQFRSSAVLKPLFCLLGLLACVLFLPGSLADELSKYKELLSEADKLASEEKIDESIAVYKRAIELDPKRAGAFFNLGNVYRKHKHEYARAIECYRLALEQDPKFAEAWDMQGLCCKRLDDMAGAEKCFKRAIEINPKDYDASCNLGYLYFHANRFIESREILQKASEMPQAQNDRDLAEFMKRLDKELGVRRR